MNKEKTESPEDEVIIQGLRESERFYEATSRVMNIPALVEDIRKRLGNDPSSNPHTSHP